MKEKVKLKSWEEIERIFSSDKFKKEGEELEERNRKLMESTEIDWKTLNRPFTI